MEKIELLYIGEHLGWSVIIPNLLDSSYLAHTYEQVQGNSAAVNWSEPKVKEVIEEHKDRFKAILLDYNMLHLTDAINSTNYDKPVIALVGLYPVKEEFPGIKPEHIHRQKSIQEFGLKEFLDDILGEPFTQ